MWLLLAGCVSSADGWCERLNISCGDAAAERPEPVDQDGDVYAEGVDCDDTDPDVNPSAEELCDQIDNNCDGQIDEGLPHVDWFPDQDRDGYGDPDRAEQRCSEPIPKYHSYELQYQLTPGDCDDTDPDVSPEGIERCDGVDNNCDGQVDESSHEARYLDADGDGYGDPDSPVYTCDEIGRVHNASDCDDGNAEIYSGALEVIDGIDNRCDGHIDMVSTARSWLGSFEEEVTSFSLLGDTNDNGIPEFGVVANSGYVVFFQVEVYFDSGELSKSWTVLDATDLFYMTRPYGVGDVNHDSYDDVMLPNSKASDGFMLLAGPDLDVERPIAWLYDAESGDTRIGAAAASSDFSGDGEIDYLIGAPSLDGDYEDEGVVWILSGPISGEADLDDVADLRLAGGAEDVWLGGAVGSAGDVDGDGLDDVLLGASGADAGSGAAYLLYGVASLSSLSVDVRFSGTPEHNKLGRALAGAGDTNGDGYTDVMISASSGRYGSAYVFLGGAGLPSSLSVADAEAYLHGSEWDDEVGLSMSALGDIEGDGLDDIAVAAPGQYAQLVAYGADLEGAFPTIPHGWFGEWDSGNLSVISVDLDERGPLDLLIAGPNGLYAVQHE